MLEADFTIPIECDAVLASDLGKLPPEGTGHRDGGDHQENGLEDRN